MKYSHLLIRSEVFINFKFSGIKFWTYAQLIAMWNWNPLYHCKLIKTTVFLIDQENLDIAVNIVWDRKSHIWSKGDNFPCGFCTKNSFSLFDNEKKTLENY